MGEEHGDKMASWSDDALSRRKPGPDAHASRMKIAIGAQESAPRGAIDIAIDRAVREMMDVDADPAFRARVFARLDRPPLHWLSWSRGAMASAAAMALIAAFVLFVTPAQETPASFPAAAVPSVVSPSGPSTAPVERGTEPPRAARGRAPAIERRPMTPPPAPEDNVTHRLPSGTVVATVIESAPFAQADAVVDSQETVQETVRPLALEPIVPPALAVPPLVITPLAPLPALQVPPLSPRVERN